MSHALKMRKQFILDPEKIRAVRKIMKAKTDTEAIDRAMDTIIADSKIGMPSWQSRARDTSKIFMADARTKVILDTSVYIPFINDGIVHPILEIDVERPVIYLSVVVIAELYAGAFDNQSIKLLDKVV